MLTNDCLTVNALTIMFLCFVVHFCLESNAAIVSVVFKDGSYTGAKATAISTYYGPIAQPGQYNDNGVSFADGNNHWCLGNNIPSGNYDQRYLIKFLNLKSYAQTQGVPSTATVVNATLTVVAHGDDVRNDAFIKVRYPAVDWDHSTPASCEGCSGEVGWRYRIKSQLTQWSGYGASGASDTIDGKEHRIPSTGTLAQTYVPKKYTGSISATLVQQWFTDGDNFGMILINGIDQFHVGIAAPQYSSSADRPYLTVHFDADGLIQPVDDANAGDSGSGATFSPTTIRPSSGYPLTGSHLLSVSVVAFGIVTSIPMWL
jgi:hypothetical protein